MVSHFNFILNADKNGSLIIFQISIIFKFFGQDFLSINYLVDLDRKIYNLNFLLTHCTLDSSTVTARLEISFTLCQLIVNKLENNQVKLNYSPLYIHVLVNLLSFFQCCDHHTIVLVNIVTFFTTLNFLPFEVF